MHALAYPIGAQFKVAHGLSNSLMLPHVLRFNGQLPSADRLYNEILADAFPEARNPASETEASLSSTERLAAHFEQLAHDLGIETKLTQVGISAADVNLLARQAMEQTRLLPNNPRELCLQDAELLYHVAL